MFHFMNFVRPFVNYAIFHELCDRMRFEVDCAKSHHRVISEGLCLRGVENHSKHSRLFIFTTSSTNNTPYSKMAAILVFFCFNANWPLWPHSS